MAPKDWEANIGCYYHIMKAITLFLGSQDPRENQQPYSTGFEKTKSGGKNGILSGKTLKVWNPICP